HWRLWFWRFYWWPIKNCRHRTGPCSGSSWSFINDCLYAETIINHHSEQYLKNIMAGNFKINGNLNETYSDVYTAEVLSALASVAHFNKDIKEAMSDRIKRRGERQQQKKRIMFLDPESFI